jgi:hypothetical protein
MLEPKRPTTPKEYYLLSENIHPKKNANPKLSSKSWEIRTPRVLWIYPQIIRKG